MNVPQKTPSTYSLVKQIKEADQDFEWYPTTDQILETIKTDMDSMVDSYILNNNPSVLDCGAGDGRSLMYLTKGSRYAIEKAKPLISAMDNSIFIIGADFDQQTLMDKGAAVTFCNPPYSDFVAWSAKIIRESSSAYIYLVIPQRWTNSSDISEAVALRSAKTEVLGQFDFNNAERAARAVVDIVKVTLAGSRGSRYTEESETDPFAIWFNSNFKIDTSKKSEYDSNEPSIPQEEVKNELVKGNSIIAVLTSLYARDLEHLVNNYKSLELLDPSLLNELDISFTGLRKALQTKIKGLKNLYWRELFNNLDSITDKLTKGSRENMLGTLTSRTDVDFNSDNIYAVVIWAIKNANAYYDKQLINLVERMVEKANIVQYKSNQKTFGEEKWRYAQRPEELDRFSLEYRVVLEHLGGLSTSDYDHERNRHNGLSACAYYFLTDILTIASNLGFDTSHRATPSDFYWESNKGRDFYCYDHSQKKEVLLMSVKAFKKGSIHIKFSPRFMMRLNVEFGRLKFWIKNAQQAADEMDIDITEAAESFNSNLQLTNDSLPLLGFQEAA